jgi:ribosomal protein S27E
MLEGYCVKCKARKPISEAVEEVMKNGRKAVKGKCPTCAAVMFKILGGKATPGGNVSEGPAGGDVIAAGSDSTPA